MRALYAALPVLLILSFYRLVTVENADFSLVFVLLRVAPGDPIDALLGPRAPREARPPREPRAPRESRKPEAIEVTSPRLYVGNLSYDASESDLFELFSGVGTVANVEIITNKHTQRSKGFGFVQMNSVSEAKRAVDELHDKDYMGRKLVVSGAKLPPDRAIGRDGGE